MTDAQMDWTLDDPDALSDTIDVMTVLTPYLDRWMGKGYREVRTVAVQHGIAHGYITPAPADEPLEEDCECEDEPVPEPAPRSRRARRDRRRRDTDVPLDFGEDWTP